MKRNCIAIKIGWLETLRTDAMPESALQGGKRDMSIKEIAEKAGVSAATVSRVLNNPNYKCSSPEVRDRIWKAAIALNYTPNTAARNLKMGIQNTEKKVYYIGVLMTRMEKATTDPFFNELLRVIESEIHKQIAILTKVWYMPLFSNDKKCRRENLDQIIDGMYEETGKRNVMA